MLIFAFHNLLIYILIVLVALSIVNSFNSTESTIKILSATFRKIGVTENDHDGRIIYASDNTHMFVNHTYSSHKPYDHDWTVIDNSLDLFPDSSSQEESIDDNNEPCLLDVTTMQMSWWVYPNGTLVDKLVRDAHVIALDLSHLSDSAETLYEETAKRKKLFGSDRYLAFSAAGNHLQSVPFKALSVINETLSYLSLRGNDFSSPGFMLQRTMKVAKAWEWARFPMLTLLKELDISNCSIQFLGAEIFARLPNLQGLYLSHNKIVHISGDLFEHVAHMTKLDLSYIHSTESSNNGVYYPAEDAYQYLNEGLSIAENAFQNLKFLIFLDISHTKISPYSVKAFSHLGPKLQFLSLCYTFMPVIPSGIFSGTDLKILDLSGNPTATLTLHENSFIGINESLEILSFDNSRLHDLSWMKFLRKVEIVKLCRNNINVLHRAHFANLKKLRLLDLSYNHIGNWYHRIFEENTELELLNLRDNNINILTTEMYRDFSNLSFLAIGHNDFICNCGLRDLIDTAIKNIDLVNSTYLANEEDNQTICDTNKIISHNAIQVFQEKNIKSAVEAQVFANFIPLLIRSHKNIMELKNKIMLSAEFHSEQSPGNPMLSHYPYYLTAKTKHQHDGDFCQITMADGELLLFKFLLLDYMSDNYWCYNDSTNTIFELADLEPCNHSSEIPSIPNLNTTHILIIGFSIFTLALVLMIPLYLKWWYIKYFFIVLKRSTAMKLLGSKKRRENAKPVLYVYDIFVSYCDRDREWVLEELLPHIEASREISICLHERDFQVGLSILENIIQCMDKSRCFLLVISKYFLSSQWCQFEMYLAQHRLFEARKEHLILVMLEEIPKEKRPKSLQYLMEIKTYIKWPSGRTPTYIIKSLTEERKLFWYRLIRSLSSIERSTIDHNNESTV